MHQPESHTERAGVRLPDAIERKLVAYTAAATAAGLGLLTCSLPAEGKVISTSKWIEIIPKSNVSLDLNNDGIPDFQFSNPVGETGGSHGHYGTLKILPRSQGNAIWGTSGSASALGKGVTIGPNNKKFQPGHQSMGREVFSDGGSGTPNYSSRGPWKQATQTYLGFKFTIHGEIHYGWARLNVAASSAGMYAAVTAYAYETVPNKAIVTGKMNGTEENRRASRETNPADLKPAAPLPGSLGSLAVGALRTSARQR